MDRLPVLAIKESHAAGVESTRGSISDRGTQTGEMSVTLICVYRLLLFTKNLKGYRNDSIRREIRIIIRSVRLSPDFPMIHLIRSLCNHRLYVVLAMSIEAVNT
jgi:hypothetical protein